MMSRFVRRILDLGPLMQDLFVSAAGCFVFTRGFSLATMGKEGSDTVASIHAAGTSRKPLAGIGAALFLLGFVASEALLTIQALRH
jgi:hypothetical protein